MERIGKFRQRMLDYIEPDDFDKWGGPVTLARRALERHRLRQIRKRLDAEGHLPY